MPEVIDGGTAARIIVGPYHGVTSAAETLIPVTYLDVRLLAGADFTMWSEDGEPEGGANAFAHVYEGAVLGRDTVGRGAKAGRGEMALLSATGLVAFAAGEAGARFLFIAGAPLNEPVARYGPFVMNNRDGLAQAVDDYHRGTFVTPPA